MLDDSVMLGLYIDSTLHVKLWPHLTHSFSICLMLNINPSMLEQTDYMFSCHVKNNLLPTFPSIPPRLPLLLFCCNHSYNPHPLLPTSVLAVILFLSFIIIISITPFFFLLLLFTFLLPLTKVVVIPIELLQILHGAIMEDAKFSLCL